MKQVFPSIRPRRLGTRGNSRYCYAALRKTTQLASPSLPDLKIQTDDKGTDDEVTNTIKTWASNLLSLKFERMEDLASYITANNMNSISAKVLQRKISRDARSSHKKLNVSFFCLSVNGGSEWMNHNRHSKIWSMWVHCGCMISVLIHRKINIDFYADPVVNVPPAQVFTALILTDLYQFH